MILVTEQNGVVRLDVKVVPGASRDRLMGEWNGRARIAVTAPPEQGRANAAVERLLARALGVRRRDVKVVQGLTTPLKTVEISGVPADQVREALAGS
ncbi:MAG: DUF167 domain-containing protein [Phycisphaerales bacterium]|nr:MAG: DUF167 domain-containing protein [Phycisphaerales bacterium]